MTETAPGQTLAVFVTPHGFGHAARAAAVCEALSRRRGESWRFELYTTVPEWFFEASLERTVTYNRVRTDIGLVQQSSLHEDPDATAAALSELIPFPDLLVDRLACSVTAAGCDAVLCDVAPLGIAVAARAGGPSVLVENFTWDWIYAAYTSSCPALERHAEYLAGWFEASSVRVQTEPVCGPRRGEAITVAPISRSPRSTPEATRARLGVPVDEPMVLVSMGGIPWSFGELPEAGGDGPWIVVPGGAEQPVRNGRALLLPHRAPVYHPDLMHASDGVIAKLGYSTVAEAFAAGVPLAYIPRELFPESAPMAAWVATHMPALELEASAFGNGEWSGCLGRLLKLPRRQPDDGERGADQAAAIISQVVVNR
jgi:hypothetical protein